MEYKTASFGSIETRASGDDWEIAGWASVFSAPDAPREAADSYQDLVMPGAYRRTLASGRKVKLLWQHDQNSPIGLPIELKETPKGLYGRWRIPKTELGKKARELVAAGLVDGLSIGFTTERAEDRNDGVRLLWDINLVEVSTVTLPAQASAQIESYKRRGSGLYTPLSDNDRLLFAQIDFRRRRRERAQRAHEAAMRRYA